MAYPCFRTNDGAWDQSAQVKPVLMQGEMIASYQDDQPFPSLLMDGRQGDDVLHVVVAFDEAESYCYVITAYKALI